jgi:SMI1 / KNR4 family (SUKH-1)
MSEIRVLLNRVIEQWRKENIPIRPSVGSEAISEFESLNAVKLPNDMREFYSTVDGMGSEYDEQWMFRFWPFEEIQSMAIYLPDGSKRGPDSASYFVFFDHSIDVFLYAIRLGDSDAVETPIAQVSPPYFDLRFESFTELLSAYVSNPPSLI